MIRIIKAYNVTCTDCGWRTASPYESAAEVAAAEHEGLHAAWAAKGAMLAGKGPRLSRPCASPPTCQTW